MSDHATRLEDLHRARSNELGTRRRLALIPFSYPVRPLIGNVNVPRNYSRQIWTASRSQTFEGCALRIEIHASDETVEIFVEADTELNCQKNDDGLR